MTALPAYKDCSIRQKKSIHRLQRAAGAFDEALDGLFLIVLLLDSDTEIAAGRGIQGQFEHLIIHAAHDKLGENGHAELMLHHRDKGGVVKVDALDILHKAVDLSAEHGGNIKLEAVRRHDELMSRKALYGKVIPLDLRVGGEYGKQRIVTQGNITQITAQRCPERKSRIFSD